LECHEKNIFIKKFRVSVCWFVRSDGTEKFLLASRRFLTYVFQTSDEPICGQ